MKKTTIYIYPLFHVEGIPIILRDAFNILKGSSRKAWDFRVNALSKGLSMLLKVPLKFGAGRRHSAANDHRDNKSVDGWDRCVNRNDLQTANLLTAGAGASTEMASRP